MKHDTITRVILIAAIFGLMITNVWADYKFKEIDADILEMKEMLDAEPEVIYIEPQKEDKPVVTDPIEWAYPLTGEEFEIACAVVMGESGGEPYEGQMAVAQCLFEACRKEDEPPSIIRKAYKYAGYKEDYTESVKNAVLAVFRDGERITSEPILYFYSPKYCNGSWHEAKCEFVLKRGGHRFFKE